MNHILDILEQDAHTPPEQIAERLKMDPDTVRNLIREWERTKVIRRYKAIVDRNAIGDKRVTAYIDVEIAPARGTGFDEVAGTIARLPEVLSVVLVSGESDLRITVECADIDEVANFVSRKLAPLKMVTNTNTHFLLRRYKDEGELFIDDEDHRLPVAP
ncbi:MAG: Lrp/AsnC family transcriptional regulator [Chthonomonadales bacterium]|nr:Lrp/AsnC family transcriptional regulator [Chthonomonadales bacterium]